MGHYACGQQEEAIAIYDWLMSTHPERSIKKTAEELKYIQEAPKMDIGDDERVEVPLLGDDYGYRRDAWAGKGGGGGSARAKPREKTLEEEYADAFEPSVRLPQNPLITAAGASSPRHRRLLRDAREVNKGRSPGGATRADGTQRDDDPRFLWNDHSCTSRPRRLVVVVRVRVVRRSLRTG